ncbi:DUF3806 domain-containing protein [Asticcacaulis sp. YBE204]|uniref:DUF3806 domain-containing protein n=1 Tax=Asticcacaulis sp. YBE204 TaxID=1282363 RepID=UPI0003C3EA8B|nr:DUF3806 domain-containing protein [Asticcacaulis sp. YBE204]ESQ81312.1 hypothetical protein AEYBE204_02935 [Asticcacaulis sp. YBE204]
MEEKLEPLSPDDISSLEAQRIWVRDHYEPEARHKFETVDGKLHLLDVILREKWIDAEETWKLQSLGVVFGDVLVQEYGCQWIMVEDQYGRDPCLCIPRTAIKLFPLTMISKRVEQGEEVDVRDFYEEMFALIEDMKAEYRVQ